MENQLEKNLLGNFEQKLYVCRRQFNISDLESGVMVHWEAETGSSST